MTATDREWFEEEEFWERYAPIMFDEARWAEVPAVVDGLARLTGIGPRGEAPATPTPSTSASRVLDLCCGLGRVSVELAARGYATTGVDITRSYLRAAQESCEDEGLSVELVCEDARRFVRPQSFDLAVNLYFSFGYFEDPSDDFLLCRNVRASLVSGGAFVIETVGKEIAMRDFIDGEWFDREGYTVLTEFTPVDSWAGIRNRWILIKGAERIERSFVQRLYSATELRRILLDAGFSSVEIYGDWDGSPYDQKARVLIAVARA